MFDPYYKWLGIRPEHQPPDHYRLLGLERFESDRDVIQAAGERQMAHVQSYKIGPQSDLSQKILTEIARAKVCLLNPTSKAEYDATLRTQATTHVPPPPVATRPAPTFQTNAPAVSDARELGHEPYLGADAADPAGIQVHTRPRAPSRKQRPLPLLLIGVCLALLAAAVASTFLFDFSRVPRNQQAVTARPPHERGRNTQPLPTVPAVDPRANHARPPAKDTAQLKNNAQMESNAATSLPRPVRSPSKNGTPALPPANARLPVPSGDEIREARSKLTIQGNPTPIQILNNAINAKHAWTRYVLLQMTIEAALKADRGSWNDARVVALEAARRLEQEYQMPADFHRLTEAHFSQPPAEKSQDARARPLPRPTRPKVTTPTVNPPAANPPATNAADVLTIDAPLVDLTKNQSEVRFKPRRAVESRTLSLADIEITGSAVVRRYPDSGQVALGDSLRVVLRDEPPRAGIEISLHGTDELYVRIKPMIQDPEDVFYPWTETGIRAVRGKVLRLLKTAQGLLERAQTNAEEAKEQSAKIRSSGTADRERWQNLAREAELDVAAHGRRVQELEQFQTSLEELASLTDRIDRKVRITFQVIQSKDGENRVVVQAASPTSE